jgi:hypothetical protein
VRTLKAIRVVFRLGTVLAEELLGLPDDFQGAALELTLKWREELDAFIDAATRHDADAVADLLADLERRRLSGHAARSGDEAGGGPPACR